MMELSTIGHSNHPLDAFMALLRQHGITAVADVRSHPYSRYVPHFNKKELNNVLKSAAIHYVFLGRELGARPANPECYVEGKAVYDRIAATADFQEGIQRLLKDAQSHRIALLCAERDPLTCHRAILVCRHLRNFDLTISHISINGELESHRHLEERMLARHGLTEFAQLEKAYHLQGDEIAYVEKKEQSREHADLPVPSVLSGRKRPGAKRQ